MNTINYEAIEDEEILFQPQGMTVEYVAKNKKKEQQKYAHSAHYFIKVVQTDKKRYIIGKQVPGKQNTFLKHIYATRTTAQKHADAKNKSYVGRGKKYAKMKKPHYESL